MITTEQQAMAEALDLIRRMAMLLDAALPALKAAADRERRREAGKRLRQITEQQRVEAVDEVIAEAEAFLAGDQEDDE